MSQPLSEYRRRLQNKSLSWSTWDKDKVITALADYCIHRWAETNKIGSHWREPEKELTNWWVEQALVLWVCSQTDEVDVICSHLGRYRQTGFQTIHLAYLKEPCIHRASALIQSGVHAVVHPLEKLPLALQRLLPRVRLSEEPSSPLFSNVLPYLRWSAED
jgi:hypothetical protein